MGAAVVERAAFSEFKRGYGGGIRPNQAKTLPAVTNSPVSNEDVVGEIVPEQEKNDAAIGSWSIGGVSLVGGSVIGVV
jgi:hypothetical protein